MEHGSQIFYQLPEIHPLVGSKIEQDLTAIEGHLRRHQLHIQAVIRNLLHADLICPFFFGPVFRHGFLVLGRGFAQHLPQRGYHFFGRNPVIASGADSELRAPGGIDDDMIPGGISRTIRVKIIDFLSGTELDIHDFHVFPRHSFDFFFHCITPFLADIR